jgi:preprotein translocase subunit YajC
MSAQAWLAGQDPSAAWAVVWQQSGGGGGLVMMLPLVLIFAVFYFLLILPQQKQKKKWQEMLGGLKNGDRVVTSGGLRGTILSVKDDAVVLRVPPDNLKLEVTRAAIVSMAGEEDKK